MQEKEMNIAGGSLLYEIQGKEACITGLKGPVTEVVIPEYLEQYPVSIIGKKAFLSRKHLRKVSLPKNIRLVEDWAFSYCDSLREIQMWRNSIQFGRDVFLGCQKLRYLTLLGMQTTSTNVLEDGKISKNREVLYEEQETKELKLPGNQKVIQNPSGLLAAAVVKMDARYLLDIVEAGTKEWLAKWDARMLAILQTPDMEGFSNQILCGEEDYGSTDQKAYASNKRKEKAELIFLRLLQSGGLEKNLKRRLEEYLVSHTKGCVDEEAWQVVLQRHGDERTYYELFARIGCLTQSNKSDIMKDIGERFPEMKAFFLNYRQNESAAEEFFSGLEL